MVGTLWQGKAVIGHILLVVEEREDNDGGEITVLALTDSHAWHAGSTIRVTRGGLTAWFEQVDVPSPLEGA